MFLGTIPLNYESLEAKMPYVLRGDDGQVQAISQSESPIEDWEKLDLGDKEYLAYLESAINKENVFRETDIQLARVLEDLIGLLIDRDLIRFTDFPAAAQKRLNYRQSMRRHSKALNIILDSGDSDGFI